MIYSIISCPSCDRTFKQESKFIKHLLVHGISNVEDYYIQTKLSGLKPRCKCSETCVSPIKWVSWKKGYVSQFARGHNARIDSAFNDPAIIERCVAKRRKGYAEGKFSVWNDGLTRATDDRIDKAALKISATLKNKYETGKLIDWRLTDPEKARQVLEKQSITKKRKFKTGELKTWNEGLAKSADPRLLSQSIAIHKTYEQREAGRRLGVVEFDERISKLSGLKLLTPNDCYRNKYMQRLQFFCVTCQNVFEKTLNAIEACPLCPKCHPKESVGQLELYEFVKTLRSDAVISDRSVIRPKEIDVLVPDTLGIEFDGLWWHSERFVGHDHAIDKLTACHAAGLPIFRIYEDEWRDKKDIVKEMIKHRLCIFERRVGARKCSIVELQPSERRTFMINNHLEGDVNSTRSWGLKNKNELVAAISIRRPFHQTYKDMFEIGRFCIQRGLTVPGALSKLVKHALSYARSNNRKGLITYVDRRLGTAKGYFAAGFKIDHETSPRFWWTDTIRRFDRFKYRADRKNGLTEKQVAEAAGVIKIWGCSNYVLMI